MILVRSPLRISLGGGGTDLPSYYSKYGGFFISAAIDKYVYVMMNRMFKPGFLVKYSQLEQVNEIGEIKHPIIRTVLFRHMPNESAIELSSTADIPAGTGLGSSGSFTSALLKAVASFNRTIIPQYELAEEACNIEINILKEPVGKQDQYIAVYGGITCFEIDTSGKVSVHPLNIDEDTRVDLEDNLMMFFTGYSRDASTVLKTQDDSTKNKEKDMIDNLNFVKTIGIKSKELLEKGNIVEFANLMNEHWEYKKKRASAMSNKQIDDLYELALHNGALGGKLIGAGGGGFLMFYAQDKQKLRQAMRGEGLQEVRFRFDFSGTSVMWND